MNSEPDYSIRRTGHEVSGLVPLVPPTDDRESRRRRQRRSKRSGPASAQGEEPQDEAGDDDREPPDANGQVHEVDHLA